MAQSKEKHQNDDRILTKIKGNLEALYNNEGFGFLIEASKGEVTFLEVQKHNLLAYKDNNWRLKSQSLWLQAGD